MFLSFLPPLGMRQSIAPYLWVLYKQITHLNPDEVVFIGTQDYFLDPMQFDITHRWDISLHAQEYASFDIPTAEQIALYRRIFIPDALIEGWQRATQSRKEMVLRMLCSRLPDLEACLRTLIHDLLEDTPIEAIFTWCNVPSLSAIANELGLPVIHNELGALRSPCYNGTAYFDFHGVNGDTEAADRYARINAGRIQTPMLSKDDILTLMLIPPQKGFEKTHPEKKIGLALQIEDDTNIVAFSAGWNSQRILEEASATFGASQTLIRHHPGGLHTYPDSFGEIDHSTSAIEFIARCTTVATINSSVALEALLFDRDTRILGDSPFAIAVNTERRTLSSTVSPQTKASKEEELRALNFLIFGYLIPYEFLYDPIYTRWRLSRPSETDILYFHLDYWRIRHNQEAQGIRQRELGSPLIQRGLFNAALLKKIAQRAKSQALEAALEARARTFEMECAKIRNSLSWRLTSPLRTIDSRIRQISFARQTPSTMKAPANNENTSSSTTPLRIAVISKADYHGGGASRVACELTELLNAAGHSADHWLSWAGGDWKPQMKSLYGKLQLPIRAANLLLRRLGLAELIPFELATLLYHGRIKQYDIVHFHDLSSAISPFTLRWLAQYTPTVWTLHDCSAFTGGCLYPMQCNHFHTRCGNCPQIGTWPLDSWFDFTGFQQDQKRKLAASGAVKYITPSNWMAQTAFGSNLLPVVPEVLPNGINTRVFKPMDKRGLRHELGIPIDRFVVLLSAGALQDERKGTHFALEVLLSVRDLPPEKQPFVLLVGHNSPEIRSRLANLDIMESGYLSDATILARHYAAADLFVFTSLADNQPLVVLETMATGTPMIGFQTGGIPEMVIQNETGFLSAPGNVSALADCLRQLIHSPDILAKWSRLCIERARNEYSHDRFLTNHLTLYRNLLADKKPTNNSQAC